MTAKFIEGKTRLILRIIASVYQLNTKYYKFYVKVMNMTVCFESKANNGA